MDTWSTSLEAQHEAERIAFDAKQEKARRDANLKLETARDARINAEHEQRERERKAQEIAEVQRRIEVNFFKNNPGASPEHYAKLKDRLLEEHQIAQARVSPVEREVAALMERSPAGYRGTW
jgi:hypothetical protein